ncbi:MAG: BrnA antitoxin family protein [Beijerinckiaceae bacterium]|nr:BrnA antitoxin family protein [Beijerinckiaceae bacterium]
MKNETITRVTLKTARKGKTDFAYLDSLTDEQLRASIADDPDWAGNEEIDWEKGHWVIPEPKKPISIRIEPDILSFFKEQGPGYQKRIQAVLRSYVDQMRAKKAG